MPATTACVESREKAADSCELCVNSCDESENWSLHHTWAPSTWQKTFREWCNFVLL